MKQFRVGFRTALSVAGLMLVLCLPAAGASSGETPQERGDRAAERIRAAYRADDIGERNRLAESALATLDELIRNPESSERVVRRSRFDRVVALRVRERMSDALASYEALLEDGYEPPAYVVQAAADAALYERQPERAAGLYRQVLETEPDQHNARLSLFYAEMEQEDFDAALSVIDELAESTRAGSRRHAEAQATAAMGRAFANRLDEALERLESLQAEYPDNHRIGQDLATVYRWRGWSERALETLAPYREAAPERTDHRLLEAGLLSDLGRFEQGGEALEKLYTEHPENRHVQRDVADWQQRERWSMSLDANYAETDNDSPFGSRERAISFSLNAPWIGHYLQPYLRHHYSDATFPEGDGDYDRISAGVHYRRGPHRIRLELDRNRTGESEAGVSAGYDLRLGDNWSLAAGYE
ncbi:MAG: tetratricopeptide repeat protein, partial [Wenzhouxiangella sp.]